MAIHHFHKKFPVALILAVALVLLPLSGKSLAVYGSCACSCCDIPQPPARELHHETARMPSAMESCCTGKTASLDIFNACEYRLPELAGSSRPRSGMLLPVGLVPEAGHAFFLHFLVKDTRAQYRTSDSGKHLPLFLSKQSLLC